MSEANAPKADVTWYVYILCCADNSFYVGHTHDVQACLDAHLTARGALHTAKHGVVRLVYSEEHATKKAAITRERQFKKWSRAKKLALIKSEFARLHTLSQSRD